MNKYFRYAAYLKEIEKNAMIFDSVKQSLQQKGFEADQNKPKYTGQIKIPGALPGVSVTCPDNPIIGGKYNVFIQIRSGRNPTKAGINTIIVEGERGGSGSAENTAAFGNADWVKQQLGIIQNELSKRFGKVSLGKLGFGSFSGGYDAVSKIIANPEIRAKTDSVVVLDGIHHGKRGQPNPAGMKPWLDFAQEAKNDPNKKFIFLYTAVDPGAYASTSDSGRYLNSNLGTSSVPVGNRSYAGVTPAAIHNAGGYTAIELFSRRDENKPGYGYFEKGVGSQKDQHVTAAKALPDVWGEYLKDWNNA